MLWWAKLIAVERDVIPAIGAAEVHDFLAASIGAVVRVFVASCGNDPQSAVVVTDGNGLFGLTTDTVRLMQIPQLVPSTVVVAVGHPDAATLLGTAQIRARDLTPTDVAGIEPSGRADDFTRFLRDELLPWLEGRFPGTTQDVTYFGHSLGGLFGTYVMLTETGLFDRYVISSPSLWWDDHMIFRLEAERAATGEDLRAAVLFGIGALETDAGRRAEAANLPAGHPFKPPPAHLDMVDDMRRFVSQLASRDYPSLELGSVEIPDEFHATVPGIVLSRALRHFSTSQPLGDL